MLGFVVSLPSDKNKNVARVGYPMFDPSRVESFRRRTDTKPYLGEIIRSL